MTHDGSGSTLPTLGGTLASFTVALRLANGLGQLVTLATTAAS